MKYLTLLAFLSSLLFGDWLNFFQNENRKFEEYKEKEEKDFEQFKKDLEEDFKNYKETFEKEYANYKRELSRFWDKPKTSTPYVWIEYSEDKKTRKIVDFDKRTITVETISKAPQKEIEKDLIRETFLTIYESPLKAHKNDEVEQRVQEKFQKKAKTPALKKHIADTTPMLKEAVFQKKIPIRQQVEVIKKRKSPTKIRPSKLTGYKVYSTQISLPRNFPYKKAQEFSGDIRKYSRKFNIESALVYAIMHSESSYNPMAKSRIPAFGLMQIVPRSAGIDAYLMVYKKKRVLPASYLYNSQNNIELGTAYLHILDSRYLKSIKDPQSRLYCVISAYNTGAGNVAKAFTGKTNIREASKIINSMNSDEVYQRLIKNLPYKETQQYLNKVYKRYTIYKKANM